MKSEPITLGDKFALIEPKDRSSNFSARLRSTFYAVLNFLLMTATCAVILWWFVMPHDMVGNVVPVLLAALILLWFFVYRRWRGTAPHKKPRHLKTNWLLADDRVGFMLDLRLSDKTAIFDGSNIYHFGHDIELDAVPLGQVVQRLRAEGYRIVCFFDANIFYTLSEHGAFPGHQKHSLALLEDIFELRTDEIYVVPKGVQADKYVLESLKHLPISFAVTNDQFRDYANQYPTVMKDNLWRKGVVISNNEIKLQQYQFQHPIQLN